MQTSKRLIERLNTFTFKAFDWQVTDELEVRLHYQLGDVKLSERMVFPTRPDLSGNRMVAFEQALKLLHWVAGVSYWKATCASDISFGQH